MNCNHNRSPKKDAKIRHFCEDYDHGRGPNKEDCDHDRSPIKTQKHSIFCKDCNHSHSPNKENCNHGCSAIISQKYDISVRTVITIKKIVIMVAVL